MEGVNFQVSANNDIYVVISKVSPTIKNWPNQHETGKDWEIHLGGWGATRSVIRNRIQGKHLAEVNHTKADFLKVIICLIDNSLTLTQKV